MTDLQTTVRDAILATPGLSDAAMTLELSPAGTVGGFVVSAGFEGLTQVERQDLLWDRFDAHLSRDVRARIAMLLTMTPAEVRQDESTDAAE